MGDVAGETRSGVTALGVPQQPGFYVKPWTVLNLGAGYEWRRYRFNLNVDNALNSKFWWQPARRISVSPYPGLTARFTTSVKF
jgi:outer membrane receptor protein involved in Fe transport